MSTRLVRLVAAIGAAATLAAGAAACGSDEPGAGPGDAITVATSTNVWGDIVEAVGGPEVDVTAIVTDPAGDPHSYQVTAKDAGILRGAALVVSNGGGYDDFVDQALDGNGDQARIVAFEVHEQAGSDGEGDGATGATGTTETAEATEPADDGHGHVGGENEHVWYDVHTVGLVATAIAAELGKLRPDARDTFTANAAALQGRLDELEDAIARLADEHGGATVAVTEPIAHHLLAESGLTDVTPAEFVEAIEEESDPPAAAVAEIQRLIADRKVTALVHNPQTETPVVTDLVAKATTADVPIVEMTETLPTGQDYVTWMGNQIAALRQAVSTAGSTAGSARPTTTP